MDVPGTTQSIKSFWDRPEGKTGMFFLLLAGIASLWGLYIALPILIEIVQNIIYLSFLIGGLVLAAMIVFNGRFQTLCKFVFKSVMRFLTGIFIQIDPIGILKEFVVEMKKQLEKLRSQIATVRGAIEQLAQAMSSNDSQIKNSQAAAEEAVRRQQESANQKDPLIMQKLRMKAAENVNQITRLKATNTRLTTLKKNLDALYQMLQSCEIGTQYVINDRENQVKEMAIERKAVKAGWGAIQSAKRILRGDADDNALYDQTMDYLIEDNSMKMGEILDFNNQVQDVLLNMDLANGAANFEAIQQLESKYKTMALPSVATGGSPIIDTIQNNGTFEPVPVKTNTGTASASGYEDLLK